MCDILFRYRSRIAYLSPSLSKAYTVDIAQVANVPTEGPNCYFTALTVNDLLKVPATTISDATAAILFLNPALCSTVATALPGTIGLEEAMATISHVFTVISSNERYEKAGPAKTDLYEYVEKPSSSASLFVRCTPMTNWIQHAVANTGTEFQRLDEQLTSLETLIDLRNGPKSTARGLTLQRKSLRSPKPPMRHH